MSNANKERCRRWHLSHREEANAAARQYCSAHPEIMKKAAKKYRLTHREKQRQQAKVFRETHPEYKKEYRKTHALEIRAATEKRRTLLRGGNVTKIDLLTIIERDKMVCGICHKKVARRDLSFDHIIPISRSGNHTSDNLQVAHLRCNLVRGVGRLPAQIRLAI